LGGGVVGGAMEELFVVEWKGGWWKALWCAKQD